MTCEIIYGCVAEDSTFQLLARVHVDGAIWTQAQVSSVAWSAWAVTDSGTAIVDAEALVVADVVFDTLQTDGRWTEDAIGYNFRQTVAASVFTTPAVYRIEVTATLVGGAKVPPIEFEVHVKNIWTS